MATVNWMICREAGERTQFWELWLDFPEIDSAVKVGRVDKVETPDGAMYDSKVGYTDRPYRPYDSLDDAKAGLLEYLADLIQERA